MTVCPRKLPPRAPASERALLPRLRRRRLALPLRPKSSCAAGQPNSHRLRAASRRGGKASNQSSSPRSAPTLDPCVAAGTTRDQSVCAWRTIPHQAVDGSTPPQRTQPIVGGAPQLPPPRHSRSESQPSQTATRPRTALSPRATWRRRRASSHRGWCSRLKHARHRRSRLLRE